MKKIKMTIGEKIGAGAMVAGTGGLIAAVPLSMINPALATQLGVTAAALIPTGAVAHGIGLARITKKDIRRLAGKLKMVI
jgi:putative effector of murein hydrolase